MYYDEWKRQEGTVIDCLVNWGCALYLMRLLHVHGIMQPNGQLNAYYMYIHIYACICIYICVDHLVKFLVCVYFHKSDGNICVPLVPYCVKY